MPRRQEPMKDVVDCEKLRGAVSERRSGDIRMGEPTRGNARVPWSEHIRSGGERGELKHLSTLRKREYSLSSGERKGRSLNLVRGEACRRCAQGVESTVGAAATVQGVRNRDASGKVLGRPTEEGESPVGESIAAPDGGLKYHGAR